MPYFQCNFQNQCWQLGGKQHPLAVCFRVSAWRGRLHKIFLPATSKQAKSEEFFGSYSFWFFLVFVNLNPFTNTGTAQLQSRLENQNTSQLCITRNTKTTQQEVSGFILIYANDVFHRWNRGCSHECVLFGLCDLLQNNIYLLWSYRSTRNWPRYNLECVSGTCFPK